MTTNNEIDKILDKTKELAEAIAESDLTKKYLQLKEKINSDREAQELLTELVNMGEDLSKKGNENKPVIADQSAENQLIKEKLEKSPVLKEFLFVQKQYFEIIKKVQGKIQEKL